MKKRNTFLRPAAITVFAFVVMVTTAMLASNTFARADMSEKLGSILIENGPSNNSLDIVDNLKPVIRDSRTSIGSYELYFHAWRNGVLEPVSSLPVLSYELILRAFVADASGVPALSGTAVFEYCSYKGRPPNDIERADEAPKEACDAGLASWRRLRSLDVDASTCPGFGTGNACMNFGIVRIPRDVGFRFRFSGRRRDIDPGVSAAANFTWTGQ